MGGLTPIDVGEPVGGAIACLALLVWRVWPGLKVRDLAGGDARSSAVFHSATGWRNDPAVVQRASEKRPHLPKMPRGLVRHGEATFGPLEKAWPTMSDYRLYFLDHADHIQRAIDLDCRDDGHAIEVAATHYDSRSMELWQRERLVKRFSGISRKVG